MRSVTLVAHALGKRPVHRIEGLLLARMGRRINFFGIASLGTGFFLRHVEWQVVSEEVLMMMHAHAKATVEFFACIIFPVAVEVSADTILAFFGWMHGNHSIHKVRPAVYLHGAVVGEYDVHHFVGHKGHRIINKCSFVVKCDFGTTTMSLSESLQDFLPVANDAAGLSVHLNLAAMDDMTRHNNGSHRRVVCVVVVLRPLSRLETTLDLKVMALDNPEVAFAVEDSMRLVECHNVRVAPQLAGMHGTDVMDMAAPVIARAAPVLLLIGPTMLPVVVTCVAIIPMHMASPVKVVAAPSFLGTGPAVLPVAVAGVAVVRIRVGNMASDAEAVTAPRPLSDGPVHQVIDIAVIGCWCGELWASPVFMITAPLLLACGPTMTPVGITCVTIEGQGSCDFRTALRVVVAAPVHFGR